MAHILLLTVFEAVGSDKNSPAYPFLWISNNLVVSQHVAIKISGTFLKISAQNISGYGPIKMNQGFKRKLAAILSADVA
jgi:hypothetical protein